MSVQAEPATLTVLSNEDDLIPITDRPTVYVEGIDAAVAEGYGSVVDAPARAQVALVRLKCGDGGRVKLEHLADVAETTTTIVDVCGERAHALDSVAGLAKAMSVSCGMGDGEYLDLVFGKVPSRRLWVPFAQPLVASGFGAWPPPEA